MRPESRLLRMSEMCDLHESAYITEITLLEIAYVLPCRLISRKSILPLKIPLDLRTVILMEF